MKTKQLANILIKILGLSVFIHAIPGIIQGTYDAVRIGMAMQAGMHEANYGGQINYWVYPFTSLVLAAIGIYLIIQSRHVTRLLFKSDDE
jgi:hypothetical protein